MIRDLAHRLVVAWLVLVTGVLAQNVGPLVGLRVPVYDLRCQALLGHPDLTGECYRYLKLNLEHFQVDPDPAGTSDGILSVKFAAPGTNPAQELSLMPRRENLPMDAGQSAWDLAGTPLPGSVDLYINGLSQDSTQYSVTGTKVEVTFAPWWSAGTPAKGWVAYWELREQEPAVWHPQVALNWTASTSPGVISYNIYRGTATGGPYTKINPSPIVGTAQLDAVVQPGTSYYYVATALDGSGNESGYSNQAEAVIPLPVQ